MSNPFSLGTWLIVIGSRRIGQWSARLSQQSVPGARWRIWETPKSREWSELLRCLDSCECSMGSIDWGWTPSAEIKALIGCLWFHPRRLFCDTAVKITWFSCCDTGHIFLFRNEETADIWQLLLSAARSEPSEFAVRNGGPAFGCQSAAVPSNAPNLWTKKPIKVWTVVWMNCRFLRLFVVSQQISESFHIEKQKMRCPLFTRETRRVDT